MKRRTFITLTPSPGASTFLSRSPVKLSGSGSSTKILILGGTNFVGPALVERAIRRGHEVTIFNRGITGPYLFPNTKSCGDIAGLKTVT